MKSHFMKIFKILLIAECLILMGCGFQLRNQNSLPAYFNPLEIVSAKPYDPFTKQLKQELVLLNNQAPDVKSNTQLIIDRHHLSYRMPIIGSSQQARIYRYTFVLEYSLIYKGHYIIKKKNITVNKLLTLNENALLTTNNQLELLTIQIQKAAIDQLINELKAPQLASRNVFNAGSESHSDEPNSPPESSTHSGIISQEVPNS